MNQEYEYASPDDEFAAFAALRFSQLQPGLSQAGMRSVYNQFPMAPVHAISQEQPPFEQPSFEQPPFSQPHQHPQFFSLPEQVAINTLVPAALPSSDRQHDPPVPRNTGTPTSNQGSAGSRSRKTQRSNLSDKSGSTPYSTSSRSNRTCNAVAIDMGIPNPPRPSSDAEAILPSAGSRDHKPFSKGWFQANCLPTH